MAVKLTITSTAEDDVDLAYRWYEGQRAGLGAQFIQRFRDCVERIVKSPEMHEIVSGNFRRTILHRFPYAVFYELTNDQVTIYAVLHTSRDLTVWQSRLQ